MKKTLIAASVSALLLAAAGTASANTLLFPFFTTKGGSVSSVSISGNSGITGANATPGQPLAAGFSGEDLHYVYNYADPKAGGNVCTHFDQFGKITANDLLQHSVSDPSVGGFGKASPSDGSLPVYLNVANTQGFLTVTNITKAGIKGITGDMLLVDPTTNLIFSYAGLSNNLDTSGANTAANEGNFNVAGFFDTNFNLSLYPAGAVSTTWYGLVTGDMSNAISTKSNWDAVATLSNGGNVYDNDENPSSGLTSKKISCLGNFAAADLTSTAQLSTLAPRGGLIHADASFGAGTFGGGAGTQIPGAATGVLSKYTGNGLAMYKIQIATSAPAAPLANKVFIHRENGLAF